MSQNDADRIAIERTQRQDQESRAQARATLLSLAQQLETEIPAVLKALAEHDYPNIQVVHRVITTREVEQQKQRNWLESLFGGGNTGPNIEYISEQKGGWPIENTTGGYEVYLLSDGRIYGRYMGDGTQPLINILPGQIAAWVTSLADADYFYSNIPSRELARRLAGWLNRIRSL